jgi:hypothetical protein
MGSAHQISTAAKQVVDGTMNREKTLGLSWEFKPAHLTFSEARRLMRDFRPVVSPAVLAVVDARQEFPAGSTITTKAIGHNQTGGVAQAFQQLAKEAFGRTLIPVRLDENIKHVTVLVHGPQR